MREGCEVHTGDLRDLDEARAATAGCTHVIHLAAIVGGIAQLPQAAAHADRGQQRALQRASSARRSTTASSASSTCRSSMVFERATEFPTTEEHLADCPTPRSAYGFSKLTGEVYCRAAHDEHGLPYTICRPFNAYGPGEMPDDEPGHRPRRARPDPQGRSPASARCRSSAPASRRARSRTSTTSPTASSPRWPRPAGLNEDFNISASRRADGRRDRAHRLGGVRQRPGRVRARAPADLRGRRAAPLAVGREGAPLLGWEAQIGVARGSRRPSSGCASDA